MGQIKTIALDTMCLIYFLDGHPQYAPLAKKLFKQLHSNVFYGITSIITKIELFSSKQLNQNIELKNAYHTFFIKNTNLKVISLTDSLVEVTSNIRRKYQLKLPDAIQIATAISGEADYFLTNDYQLKKVKEIHIITFEELPQII